MRTTFIFSTLNLGPSLRSIQTHFEIEINSFQSPLSSLRVSQRIFSYHVQKRKREKLKM